MEKLLENLSFLCGSIGACLLVLTIYVCCKGIYRLIISETDNKTIKDLKKENKELKRQLETKTEMERLRYEHQKFLESFKSRDNND